MRARYRAWRFVLPQLLLKDETHPWRSAGLQVTPTGRIDMVEEDESVRQAILMLIETVPGERVMRPDYGCNLDRLMFAPNDETTAGLAIHYVRIALDRWEPRIDIVGLDAQRDPQRPGELDILLDYRVRASRRVEQLRLPIDLAGGA
jgi:phage baseplate assembly protein W